MADEKTAPAEPIAAPAAPAKPDAPATKAIVLLQEVEISGRWERVGKALRLPAAEADALIPVKARLATPTDIRVAGIA